MELDNISKNIKSLRENSNLSQTELAKKLGITKQAISYYERGLRLPDLHNLIKISKFFNTSLDSIVFTNSDVKIDELANIVESNLDQSILNTFLKNLEISNEINSNLIQFLKKYSSNENNSSIENVTGDINFENQHKTEIAEEISPVISISEYKSSKNSIDVDFYNENNVFIVDASPFATEDTIKVYSYGNISAGIPTFGEDSIDDDFNIFKYDLKYDSDHYFVLKVKGESMNRLYKDGDYLLVEKSCNYNLNDPVIIFLEDEATVKFVEIDDFHITLIPYSTDPKFEPVHYPLKNYNYYIAGNVVGVINIIKDN